MATIVKRVVGALLALLGLALTVVGTWFATQLGSSGTAEFTVRPNTADPVVIGPDVLNRVDADVVVTATPTESGSVWMALANPSDATAVLGSSKHLAVTGVSVADWALLTSSTGSGAAPELGAADLWRQQDDAKGPVSLTVQQSGAPETLVVAAQTGQLRELTLRVTDKSWFVEAVVAALVGLFLLVAGVVLLTARRGHHGTPAVPPVPDAPGAATAEAGDPDTVHAATAGTFRPAAPVEGSGHTEPTVVLPPTAPHDPQTPEEVTR